MVTVPKTRQVRVAPDPTPLQQISGISGEAFGGAEARGAQAIGQGLANVGEAVGRIAQRQIDIENERLAKELDNEFTRRKRELLYGPDGLYSQRGNTAVESSPDFVKKLQDIQQEISAEAKNDTVRTLYSRSSERNLVGEIGRIDRFVVGERRVAAETASVARIKEAQDDAVAAGGDADTINRSKAIIRGEVFSQAELNGWAPEVTQSQLESATTALHQSVINGLIQRQEVARAQAYFDEYGDEMDGPIAAGAAKALQEAGQTVEAQRQTARIMTDPDLTTTEDRVKWARENLEGALEDEVVKRIKLRSKEAADAQAAFVKQKEADASAMIYAGSTLEDFKIADPIGYAALTTDPDVMKSLSAAETAVAEDRIFSNTTTGELLRFQKASTEELAALSIDQLESRRHLFTKAEWNQLGSMIQGAQQSLDQRGQSFNLYTQFDRLARLQAPEELNWGSDKASTDEFEQQQQIRNTAHAWIAQNPDASPANLAAFTRQLFFPVEDFRFNFNILDTSTDVEYFGQLQQLSKKDRSEFRIDLDNVQKSVVERTKQLARNAGVTGDDQVDEWARQFLAAEIVSDAARQRELLANPQVGRR